MKYTKISPDKAYELYKKGCGCSLYFLDVGCKNYSSFVSSVHYWDKTQTREYFRAFHCFIGVELPKVTVRQKIEVHCTIGPYLRDDVLKIINIEHAGGEDGPFARTEELSNALDKARESAYKYILFDIDSNGEKSNFRFE